MRMLENQAIVGLPLLPCPSEEASDLSGHRLKGAPMGHSNWSFQGTDYRMQWNTPHMLGSLQWGDLLSIPLFSPLAAVSSLPGNSPTSLGSFPGPVQKRFRTWNASGSLFGLPLSGQPRFQEGDLSIAPSLTDRSPALSWKVDCRPQRVLISAALENRTGHDLFVHGLVPLAGTVHFTQGPPSAWRIFKMGSNTTMPSGSVRLDASERNLGIRWLPSRLIPGPAKRMFLLPDEGVSLRRGLFSSQWFTLLVHPDSGAALLIGFSGVVRHFSTLRLDANKGCLQAAALAEGCALSPGKRFESHRLVLWFGKNPDECIEHYLGELAGTEPPRFPKVSLWGSWYSGFYDRFQWKDLQDNMEAASRAPQKIEYFQLDDGYQKAIGDWTQTLDCLPDGLPGFARAVQSYNMKPGLWVAPFAVGRDAQVGRDHPEWLVKGPSGAPVRAGFMAGRFRLRPYYALDLTQPAVLAWIYDLFQTLVHWGFQLFKLDFLAAGTVPGARENKGITTAQSYHDGMSMIRKAVGDRPLLGALAPQLCGQGIMDIQRVSTDSSFGGNSWQSALQRRLGDSVTPCVFNNLRNNFTRFFLGDRLWTNDCDAILFGGLSPLEQKTHMASNLLLGGVFQVGFDLRKPGYPWPDIDRLRSYRVWFRTVPDLFEREFPEEALIGALDPHGENVLLYLIVNPGSRKKEKTLRNPSPLLPSWELLWEQARECGGAPLERIGPGVKLSLASRDSRLFEIPMKKVESQSGLK
jgi:hypothetical protein